MSGNLSADVVLLGYVRGVFPMAKARDDPRVYFVDPDMRGILPLQGFHVPRRLRRQVRRGTYDIRFDTAFEDVIDACAAPTPSRPDSWINPAIRNLYLELGGRGFLHTVEAWCGGELVGGLYGIALRRAFFGESMFSRADNASKIALVHLVARLRAGGFSLLDIQFLTDHLRQFGALEIPRQRYRVLLDAALREPADFCGAVDDPLSLERVLQSSSQIS